jgi:hypothetical protein
MLKEAIELLERTIDKTKNLAILLRQTGLPIRADCREKEVKRLRQILDLLEKEANENENVIKVLAKEVRRVRALVEVAETQGTYYPCGRKELDSMRRMLAMLIKGKP